MEIEVAIMEPKYQINLGHMARVSKNFGVKRLILINPRCNHRGKLAIKYSKHARELLEKASVLKHLGVKGNSFIIGTTGIWHKTGDSFYNVYSLVQLTAMARRSASARKKVIVLMGRDDTGLSKSELRMCDATVCIGADRKYPILNISHALAIILHALRANGDTAQKMQADYEYQERLFSLFAALVKGNPRIRDKESVKMAFRHVIKRSVPTRKEINALSIALAPHKPVIGRKQKRNKS
ncbi:MAG: RNA methyltransferase [Candidatus Micrarchaeota archaeon]|nr:RNA methyltransferase [Candidatus Micrarchaeota archaeon]